MHLIHYKYWLLDCRTCLVLYGHGCGIDYTAAILFRIIAECLGKEG
jgi:hypothetical protein